MQKEQELADDLSFDTPDDPGELESWWAWERILGTVTMFLCTSLLIGYLVGLVHHR